MKIDFITIGKIISTQGRWGEVKVFPLTDYLERFYDLTRVYISKEKNRRLIEVEKVRLIKNFAIIQFLNIKSIEEAKLLINYYLEVDKDHLINLPKERYFIFDIIDLEVYTEESIFLGKIIDVLSTGSNDIYVVKHKRKKEILIPAIHDVVKKIDLKNNKMIIKLIDGLL